MSQENVEVVRRVRGRVAKAEAELRRRATTTEGVGLEQASWFVVTVRDGKVARTEGYRTHEQALEAGGLRGR